LIVDIQQGLDILNKRAVVGDGTSWVKLIMGERFTIHELTRQQSGINYYGTNISFVVCAAMAVVVTPQFRDA
jgi:hypothetical protein